MRRIVRGKLLARLALFGLAITLVVLAGLSVASSVSADRSFAEVGEETEQSQVWSDLQVRLGRQRDLAHRHLHEQSPELIGSLAQEVAATQRTLDWLVENSEEDEAEETRLVAEEYDKYRRIQRRLLTFSVAGSQIGEEIEHEAEETYGVLAQHAADFAGREQTEASEVVELAGTLHERLSLATVAAFGTGLALLAACVAVLLSYQRRVERQAAESQHQALHDALTGLPNRALFADRTGQALRAAERDGMVVGLLLLDLDRFKEVNDTLGHHQGDHLLREVSHRLASSLRGSDTVARLGGDEFAILLPAVRSLDDVNEAARRVLAALAPPTELDGITVDIESSVGLAAYPHHGSTVTELLQRADVAMYAAKAAHGGAIVTYDQELDGHNPRRLALLGELRRGIERGELVLYYQPKMDLQSRRIAGVEALVRWQHPEHGLLPPGEFIPLAERTGLIQPLTRHVLAEALRQCRQWTTEGIELSVAVNISSRCLLDGEFPAQVADLLRLNRVDAAKLTLEITESTIMTDPDRAFTLLSQLQAMGVQLSIDDFGTGYSSMVHLRNLPVNELKVDRSFVSQMRADHNNAAIVRAVVDLGRDLGLHVVAEGVEDEETGEALAELGCHSTQGYYLTRPLPATALAQWLPAPTEQFTAA